MRLVLKGPSLHPARQFLSTPFRKGCCEGDEAVTAEGPGGKSGSECFSVRCQPHLDTEQRKPWL